MQMRDHFKKQKYMESTKNAQIEANASLIAAAPDMLMALKRWQDEWVINGNPSQRANIEKAEQNI